MALPILQIERKFREFNRDFYKTDFVFYGVINRDSQITNYECRITNGTHVLILLIFAQIIHQI